MTYAPVISPRPPERPDWTMWQEFWFAVDWAAPASLQYTASAQFVVMLAWVLVLVPLAWWVRRRLKSVKPVISSQWRVFTNKSAGETAEKPCNWHMGSMRMPSGAQKWHCDTCGGDGFSHSKEPPSECNWSKSRVIGAHRSPAAKTAA